jgi:BirA family biotin operon repressor/biotin-[acetyl-CoA-carboxylase] ligase
MPFSDPDPVAAREDPDDLAAVLRGGPAGLGLFSGRVRYVAETTSTQDEVCRLAAEGAPHGSCIVAGRQTAGRGRFGRAWFSPPDAGLYVSMLFRPEGAAARLPVLTLGAAVALVQAIERTTGVQARVKWPNDLVIARGGRTRKLAGILAEGAIGEGRVSHVVLGAGINLRRSSYPDALGDRATSVEEESGRPADRGAVLAAVLSGIAAVYDAMLAGQSVQILDDWRALSPSCRGATVEWEDAAGRRRGITCGIDADGALLVRAGCSVHRLVGGPVSWTADEGSGAPTCC